MAQLEFSASMLMGDHCFPYLSSGAEAHFGFANRRVRRDIGGAELRSSTLCHLRFEICIKVPFLYNPFDLRRPSAFETETANASLSYLKESLQPPHLEDTLPNQHS
jgi:hypothetical protein